MRSTRRISWTRTVSWVIMDAPPRVACLDTRHPRRLLASEQVPMRFSIYDRTSVSQPAARLRQAASQHVAFGDLSAGQLSCERREYDSFEKRPGKSKRFASAL
jgi:hypothetical protein